MPQPGVQRCHHALLLPDVAADAELTQGNDFDGPTFKLRNPVPVRRL
jgi:hypothetical protein